MKEIDEKHIHDGHRERMRAKLIQHGVDIFENHELLEMLLFFKIPYKNTNPIAKNLILKFGTLDGVFDATEEQMCTVAGVGPRCADFLKKIALLFKIERCDAAPDDTAEYVGEAELAELAFSLFSKEKNCTLAVFAFDNSNRLIATEKFYGEDLRSGSLGAVYYTNFALKNAASMIVTASNRRYGSSFPLPSDRECVGMISRALTSIDVLYGEHFVFAGDNYSRVFPTLRSSIGKPPILVEKMQQTQDEYAENANYSCHNDDVFLAFDEVMSFVGNEHTEKTKKLFERYTSVISIFTADYETLKNVVGQPYAVFIRLIAGIAKRRMFDKINKGKMTTENELCAYLFASCLGAERETIFLVSYGANGKILAVDKAAEGTINSSSVLPRSLLELALKRGATRVAVAHNHPFGRGELSGEDIAFTRKLQEAFWGVGVELFAHYCITGEGVFSLSAPFDNL